MALKPLFPSVLFIAFLATGCSIHQDQALLIRQSGPDNKLQAAPYGRQTTDLDGVRFDPRQIPATPSQSLAITPPSASPKPPEAATLAQAQQTLMAYLALVEKQPEEVEKLIADAERLAARYPQDGLLQALLQRLSRYTLWSPVNSIIGHAGIDFVSVRGWRPESPFIRIRRALLPPVADDEHVIFGDQRLVLLMTNPQPLFLPIELRLEDLPFLPESPARVRYRADDDRIGQTITLSNGDDWRQVSLYIPAGNHVVRIDQPQPVGNQYVKIRFNDNTADMSVAQEWPYFISSHEQPLSFYSLGPALLRIDELADGDTVYRYREVPEGWHAISLPPAPGQARSLLRVSQRTVNLKPQPLRNRIVQRPQQAVPAPDAAPETPPSGRPLALLDAYALGQQEDGTLSAGLDFVRRNNRQESGTTLPLEQFAQHRLEYRYFDEAADAYWNTQALYRIREFGGPTFGVNETLYFNPDWLPFNVQTSAKLYAQDPHDGLEALGQWNLSLSQPFNLHPKTQLIPSLSFFARVASLHDSDLARNDPAYKLKIDQDVFTPYKADHGAGLTPALTLRHRPWLDTLWSVKGGVGSNENLDFTAPDHYRLETHWQQLLGDVVVDASYRSAYFQADNDRERADERSYLELELNWQHWTVRQHRLELSTQYSYDLQRQAHLATVSLTLHLGEGRGLRDFAPNEVAFGDFRQRQFAGENNLMRAVDSDQ